MSKPANRNAAPENAPEGDPEATVVLAKDGQEGGGSREQELRQALAAAEAKAEENWNSYLRIAAELDNMRKRAVRDVENAHKFGLERFASELLAVKDTLELGLEAAGKADAASLLAGKEATLKLLGRAFEKFNIAEINPQPGQPFDPQQHEAMAMQESADVPAGTVLQVVQKGYVLNGRLLRPARVLVAKAPGGQQ